MKFKNVSILALSQATAPHRITSEELEDRLAPTLSRLGMNPGTLSQVAGIKARRFWDKGTKPSDAATKAAIMAIEKSGIDRSLIKAIVNTSVCRDYLEPSTACIVHHHLGLASDCINFDLGNACLGFINGMDLVASLIERGEIEYGIVVDGEGSQDIVDTTIQRLNQSECTAQEFRAQFATFTLGSGGAAMILCRKDLAPHHPTYRGGVQLAATQHYRLCHGQPDYMQTDTKGLLMAGLELANRVWIKAKDELGWKMEELDHLVLHQVSQVHTMSLAQTLGLDINKAHITFDELGNIGPAAVPITLAKAVEEGKIKENQRIALLAIGSGLNCEMAEIVWGTENA